MTTADDAVRPDPGAHGEAWQPDLLGRAFEARELVLPEGARATLVRHTPSVAPDGRPARVAVLAVHGFADYFFHPHVAEAFAAAGHAFYAVDLRGHGRSWDSHVAAGGDPNLVPDVAVYAQDLDAGAATIRVAGHERLVVLGHSTGGLIAPLWASARPGRADALVLNSPWFQHNAGLPLRWSAVALAEAVAPVAPRAVLSQLDDAYARALHVDHGGEWPFDPAWKPHAPFPVRAAWFRSIRRAQRRLARGLDLDVPVLVLTSDRSTSTEHLTSDTVLDVAHMRAIAPRLGDDVNLMTIAGGTHDLSLSPPPAREEFLRAAVEWVDASV
ncbi:alpha-beta hydrolase superfamily lysophospholipase [Isoptericola jiangsuensis]|uniref:Alpha-beta hydrolase superfamily lysophospholipase n=1 Tax=Isoptericola jiangsuensis TaxID=548579 RepID=A0A2A9ERZ0_9MICO|nr:alpha/beta hydrolase [Isoptericola jiangsuensis]PFG41774.1 alpha-beta hydrolase superfamily lysophospholipase [Isoptericola jiangsuensis]